ncbi:MAG: rhodanese-like domain-containing protein [Chthoniobacterales bacterium]|nr:rhodanese-like domain-containing protein [Chthoniobacterales bacterium]
MRASLLVRQVVILVGLAFLPAIGQALYYRGNPALYGRPPDPGEVTLAQTKGWGASVLWIDARPNEEFEEGHVPGAMSLNEDEWNRLLPAVLAAWTKERELVVYCSRESCNASRAVADRLRNEVKLKNVHVLPGGWEEWKENANR